MPSPLSMANFCSTAPINAKGGKINSVSPWPQWYWNASMNIASGSGCHEQYRSVLWFVLEANRSMSGFPSFWQIAEKTECSSVHSVSSLNCLDARSVSTLTVPGQWAALNHSSLSFAKSQICLATLLICRDLTDPGLLIAATVVVLSDMIRICYFASVGKMIVWQTILEMNTRIKYQAYFDQFVTNGFYPKIVQPCRFTKKTGTVIDHTFCKLSENTSKSHSGILISNMHDHLPHFTCLDILSNQQKPPKYIIKEKHDEASLPFYNEIESSLRNTHFPNELTTDPNVTYNL